MGGNFAEGLFTCLQQLHTLPMLGSTSTEVDTCGVMFALAGEQEQVVPA